VCSAGTPALGVAGTGDVLCGVIAALCARLPPFEAAYAGVLLHATAGELAAVSDRGLLAGEVADALPRALAQLRASANGSRGTL
jgi:NAD(P)H-hydrate repair Nnr-like enzyme with NAD(P)H-hydrate dehydratase domain